MISIRSENKQCIKLKSLSAFAVTLFCGVAFGSAAVLADGEDDAAPQSYPYLKGAISIELQSDHTVHSHVPDAELSDSYKKTEAALEFHFSPRFSIQTGLVFEPVLGPEDDRAFEDHGLYAEQLFAQYEFEPFKVFAGKFNVNFGKAWDITPGVYGTDFAEGGYEFTERLGFGASFTRNAGAVGEITVTSSLFRADTSTLSNSAFTNRGQTGINDGGFGNSESLSNFNLAIDGEKIPWLSGVGYHLAYIHQERGRDTGVFGENRFDDQNGFVAGVFGEREYNSVKFNWNLEAAYLDNYLLGGETAVEEIWFLTAGGKLSLDKYNVAGAYTYRPAELIGGGEFEDHQLSVSAGYQIRDDLTLDLGYKYHVEEEQDNHTVGVLLTKELEFDTSNLK